MKRILISSAIIASLFSCSNDVKKSDIETKNTAVETTLSALNNSKFSTQDSRVFWAGTKAIGGGHSGDLLFKSGSVKFEKDNVISGNFEVDMKSMTCSDIKDSESNKDLLDHLMSEDFFFVEGFPTIDASLYGKTKDNGETYQTIVKLNIKGITREEKVILTKIEKNNQIQLHGKLKIDRTNYEITYNSGNVFENLGDKIIDDIISLKVLIIFDK